MEYQFFPRLCAISEAAWTNAELKDYERFYNAITSTHYNRLHNMGIKFRLPFPEVVYEEGALKVTLPYEGAVVRYTTDESDPTVNSPVYKGEIKTDNPKGYRFATFYKDCNQSISVGASNIELYDYITPEVSIESSYKENECNKSFPMSNITTYKYNKYCRINRRSQAGDWLKYSFKEPVECSRITVETGIPGITLYDCTEGYVEYTYNGTDYIKGEEFKNGIAVIRPEDKVLAVRIVFTGMSDAMITSFQNLRIEK
jgi:hexosaminidase